MSGESYGFGVIISALPTPPNTVDRINELKNAIKIRAIVLVGLFKETHPFLLKSINHSLHFDIFDLPVLLEKSVVYDSVTNLL